MHSQTRIEPGVHRFLGRCLDHHTTPATQLSHPCDENGSNLEAEAFAIKAAIEEIEENQKKSKY